MLVIGTNGCSRCRIVKTLLERKGIKFEYKLLGELSNEDSKKYLDLAEEADQFSFPIIIKDGKVIDMKEV